MQLQRLSHSVPAILATLVLGLAVNTGVQAQGVDCSSPLIPNYVKVQNGCPTTPTPIVPVDCASPLIPHYVKRENGCPEAMATAPAAPAQPAPVQPAPAQPGPAPQALASPPADASPAMVSPATPLSANAPLDGDCSVLDGVYDIEAHGFRYYDNPSLVAVPPKEAYPDSELVIQGAGPTCSWAIARENVGGLLTLAPIASDDWQRWLYQQPLPVGTKFVLSNWPYAPSGIAEGFIAPSDGGFQALGTFHTPDPSLFVLLKRPGVLWITWRLNPNPCGPDNPLCPGLPGTSDMSQEGQGACGGMDLATCAMRQQAADNASLTGTAGR